MVQTGIFYTFHMPQVNHQLEQLGGSMGSKCGICNLSQWEETKELFLFACIWWLQSQNM